ncbi:MAG: hypothetical protein IKK05_01060 [Alistipes sp.]|nr:hypothetical protein [Alistipes sp.]
MKKLFSTLALCAIALTTLSSCDLFKPEEKKNDAPEYEASKLTPSQHQEKLETIALEIVNAIDPADVEELATSLTTLSERIPKEEQGGAEELARSIQNLDVNNIVALVTRASEELILDINDPELALGGICVEFKEDGTTEESEIDDKRAIMIKWESDAIVLSWGENKGEYTFEDSIEGVKYIVKLPSFIKIAITLNGVEHFSANIEPNVTDNYTYAPALTIKLNGGYELYSKVNANNKGVGVEGSFKKNGKKLIGSAAAISINDLTNPDNWYEEYYDEYYGETVSDIALGEYIGENVTNGTVQVDLLTLSIIGTGDLRNVIDEMNALDERYNNGNYPKEYYDEGCAIVNKYLKVMAVYNDTNEKIADVILQTVEEEYYDEYLGKTDYIYYAAPILVFPDGSKFAFEDFFTEESFSDLIERIGEIAGSME